MSAASIPPDPSLQNSADNPTGNAAGLLVVIVNWERPGDTIQCIRSLQRAAQGVEQPVRILVVDNGSQDGSVEKIRETCSQVELLALSHNQGFAGGYNAGIQRGLETGAGAFFLLNNDTVVEPGALGILARASWDVAVPKILYYDQPERIWAAGARWRSFPPSVVMRGYRKMDGPQYEVPTSLEYATGCALMVRRQVLESVGGFDPDFENYMEDYDFSYRVRAAGFTMGYAPSARILHKVSQTLGALSPERWRYQGRNTVRFYRKEDRFPALTLWSFLAWFFLRETLKGQTAHLPAFWAGVRQGLQQMKQASGR